uniref:Uncharacterized protein n=1 Tax=Trichobilharzia regenti TaxID=157069 RepID=A0AA85IY26_TRIRE|nr:unnamed protein product [Trichobilharzia regenti]
MNKLQHALLLTVHHNFYSSYIQQSTQNDLLTLRMRRALIQSKLKWNAVDLQKNNVTLKNITKALQERIENINIQLSPDGLSINDYAACKGKLMEAETGVGLMQNFVEAIEIEENFGKLQRFITNDTVKMKECFENKKKKYEGMIDSYEVDICSPVHPDVLHQEIEEMTDLISDMYSEIQKQTETVFQRKLYTYRLGELEKLIPAE